MMLALAKLRGWIGRKTPSPQLTHRLKLHRSCPRRVALCCNTLVSQAIAGTQASLGNSLVRDAFGMEE